MATVAALSRARGTTSAGPATPAADSARTNTTEPSGLPENPDRNSSSSPLYLLQREPIEVAHRSGEAHVQASADLVGGEQNSSG